ncbi:MAG: hypothetical protein WD010_09425 [Nitriliruptor sp.]
MSTTTRRSCRPRPPRGPSLEDFTTHASLREAASAGAEDLLDTVR